MYDIYIKVHFSRCQFILILIIYEFYINFEAFVIFNIKNVFIAVFQFLEAMGSFFSFLNVFLYLFPSRDQCLLIVLHLWNSRIVTLSWPYTFSFSCTPLFFFTIQLQQGSAGKLLALQEAQPLTAWILFICIICLICICTI